jgi:hypothetical protein
MTQTNRLNDNDDAESWSILPGSPEAADLELTGQYAAIMANTGALGELVATGEIEGVDMDALDNTLLPVFKDYLNQAVEGDERTAVVNLVQKVEPGYIPPKAEASNPISLDELMKQKYPPDKRKGKRFRASVKEIKPWSNADRKMNGADDTAV